MKKMILALAVLLLAAPAWATNVEVKCVQSEPNKVEIWYETDASLPRAFGLDITITDGNIVDCEPAMVGECSATVRGLGIFPGTIIIDGVGNVTSYGNPVAPQSDLPEDTKAGLGSSEITIEMGSLYVDGNAPDPCGLLCTLTVELTTDVTMTITANVSRAGNGVVLEDPDEVAIVTLGTCPLQGAQECFYEGLVDCCGHTVTAAEVATWVGLGKPACWCYPCHCRADSDGNCLIQPVDALALRDAWPGLGGTYNECVDVDYSGPNIQPVDALALRDAWPGLGGPGCAGCPPCP